MLNQNSKPEQLINWSFCLGFAAFIYYVLKKESLELNKKLVLELKDIANNDNQKVDHE